MSYNEHFVLLTEFLSVQSFTSKASHPGPHPRFVPAKYIKPFRFTFWPNLMENYHNFDPDI